MPKETVADKKTATKPAAGKGAPDLLSQRKSGGYPQDIDRPLPSSIEAEKGVLSCMLQSCAPNSPLELVGAAIEKIDGNHFFVPSHRILYEILVEYHDASKPIDLISLTQVLMDRGQLDNVGGASAVADIYRYAPTVAHFDFYVEIIKGKMILRQVIETCTESISKAYEDQENIESLLDDVERTILSIREGQDSREGFRAMKDEVMEAIEAIELAREKGGAIVGLSTGFKDLDKMTSGLHSGEMIIIAARPSMGKTSLAMNIVEHVGIVEKKPVAVFSLEMGTQQLVQRLISSRSEIEMQKLRTGSFLSHADFHKITEVAHVLASSPIFIDDSPGLSILELRAKARRLMKMTRGELALIAVDYLQLLRSTSKRGQENRQIEIAEISSGLKGLSKELGIPIIVLAQLNRNPEQRGGGKPRLSDLRESGSIEQDADVVALLVREEYYADDEEERKEAEGKAELIIAKQRNGPTGEVPLTFIKKSMRFVDRAPDHDMD